MIGRDRNKVKHDKWHFYLRINPDCAKMTETIKKLKETVEASTGRKPGGSNEPLKMERPTAKTVEITWPTPVSNDTCTRVLKFALGQNWKAYVSPPAGVGAGTQVPAATAETAEEGESLEELVGEALEAAASAAAAPPEAAAPAPSRKRRAAVEAAPSSEAPAGEAYARDQDDIAHRHHHLLSMRLEALTQVYQSREPERYEVPPTPFDVDWDAELGQGSFGKVYFGKLQRPGGGDDEVSGLYAIKMLRDSKQDQAQGFNSDAVHAAEEEVRRHAALGFHPNVVRLVDVGFFTRTQAKELRQLAGAAGRRTGGEALGRCT